MSRPLRDRFPLQASPTIYMDGRSVYNLYRFNRAGIIASVDMRHEDAEAFRVAVREALAEVWDEAITSSPLISAERELMKTENPYRKES